MTNIEFQNTFAEYRMNLFYSAGSLADRLRCLRPNASANIEAWTDALLHGLKTGDELAKAFEGMAFDTERFFHANGSEFDEAEFQKAAEEMTLYITEHPDMFKELKGCLKSAPGVPALAVKLMNQRNELLYKTALHHQTSTDALLTNPDLYDRMSRLDADTRDLIPAACCLLSGLDANAFSEENACGAAFQFGFITGVSRESVRQAVASFDADAFKRDMCRYNPAIMLVLALAISAAILIGAEALLAYAALFESLALVEILSSILVFFTVTAAVSGVLCLPVYYFLREYTDAGRKIEKESANRTQSILQRIDVKHTSLKAASSRRGSVAQESDCISE